eukprot:Protomagalhaensia_sp_Gyna_25__3421@NODE_308_length_3960_cov_111_493497_g239_i0_p3_GENE_NODE_308_length_3960_cov_111_493497_g239_i0NODE_308_length_3960_cov_111_493497_g239_i0_p3_ORF_typecomplete_len230_score33_46CBM_20/PF00686_19/4_5CBM_20/PF00686_19/0_14Baculo_RING/PF05883_11/0_3Vpu/PF00558_19/0_43Importin_rep_6/PF18829_1/0_69Importin_rep_6/PF18829_1/4_3e02_NODE_308_length_3960_cov_111_493497_g239_i0147836
MDRRGTFITFEVKHRLPKGRDIRLFVAGTLPELGYLRIDDPRLSQRLERNIKKMIHKSCIREWRRQQRDQHRLAPVGDDSEDESDADGELLSEISRTSDINMKVISSDILNEVAVPLEPDPEDTGEMYLWASEPVRVDHPPGTRFSYMFFAWDLDNNRLWTIERFAEARELTVPKTAPGENHWRLRAAQVHSKAVTFTRVVEVADSDDEYSANDRGPNNDDDDDDYSDV